MAGTDAGLGGDSPFDVYISTVVLDVFCCPFISCTSYTVVRFYFTTKPFLLLLHSGLILFYSGNVRVLANMAVIFNYYGATVPAF